MRERYGRQIFTVPTTSFAQGTLIQKFPVQFVTHLKRILCSTPKPVFVNCSATVHIFILFSLTFQSFFTSFYLRHNHFLRHLQGHSDIQTLRKVAA